MPIRESKSKLKIWRKFEIGSLFQLFMLDTRSIYRDKQLNLDNYINKDKFDVSRFKKDLFKKRNLVGKEQFKWLNENLDNNFKWSIIGQQVLVAPTVLPEIFSKIDKSKIPEYLHKYIKIAGMNIPYNTDSWDGYPNEREKLYKVLSKSQSNVVLTGDTHNSWISNLYNKYNEFIAVEIATPAISSPNTVDTFGSITKDIDSDFVKSNKHLKWTNGSNKGFVKLTITSDNIEAKFLYVSTVKSKDYYLIDNNQFVLKHNQPL
jgi:alkaline phosphatase D